MYFIELSKGTQINEDNHNKQIIVIDDPISSLSHNYIFNIAQLIKHNYFIKVLEDTSNIEQVFVLTHNLYFFSELNKLIQDYGKYLRNDRKSHQCFRIAKKSCNTKIQVMKDDEIRNDYQSYWKIIKESEEHHWLVANSMRNILEYFFGFVYNKDTINYLNKLDTKKFNFFIRYMNRESHSDVINISDIKDIDLELFKNAFEEVFQRSGFIEHYNLMMK